MLGGTSSTFFSKEMLYTAITRARKNVILIGDGVFRSCIENGVRSKERQTLLKERLAEAI